MDRPLVSVVIPVYGAEKYIVETISSVLAQSYAHFEIIAVVDGSPDNSSKLIAEMAQEDTRIHLFEKENSGVSDTRNYGIEQAKGEFIAFLDADDTWVPSKLELQVMAFKRDPSLSWVFGDAWIADEYMNPVEYRRGWDEDILNDILIWDKDVIPGPSSNICVRSQIMKQEGVLFDKNLTSGADQDITIQLASKYKGIRIDEALWNYRVLPGSMSSSVLVTEKDHLYVFEKAKANGLFRSKGFERFCFAKLYLMIAGSWWTLGNNKKRAVFFMIKAVLKHPVAISKLVSKLR